MAPTRPHVIGRASVARRLVAVAGAGLAFTLPPAQAASAPVGPAAPAHAPVAGPGKSRVTADAFTVEMKAASAYAAGQEGVVEVVLAAKGDFKINAQFPTKLKMGEPPEGVTYRKPVLKKDDGTFTEKEGSFKAPFVAQKPGQYTVGATVSLSVCNEKKCLMEKVAVDVAVTVK